MKDHNGCGGSSFGASGCIWSEDILEAADGEWQVGNGLGTFLSRPCATMRSRFGEAWLIFMPTACLLLLFWGLSFRPALRLRDHDLYQLSISRN